MMPTQFITPQLNAPTVGVIQDCLLAARMFTRRDTFLTRANVCQLLMVMSHEDDTPETKKALCNYYLGWSKKLNYFSSEPKQLIDGNEFANVRQQVNVVTKNLSTSCRMFDAKP